MKYVVGVGDMKVGAGKDVIITYAIGSCLGLMVYDPVAQVGGMLHAMLPLSKINPEKGKTNPFMFVDLGVSILFKEIYDLNGLKKRLVVKIAGCGQPLGNNEMFKIGNRNYTVLKKLLWKNGIMLAAEDVGGTISRTVSMDLSTGRIIVSSNGEKREL